MSRVTNQAIYELLESVAVQVNSNSVNIAEMQSEIGGLRSDLQSEVGTLRSELHREIGSLRSELHTDISSVREDISDLRADLQEFKQSETEDIFVITQMLLSHDRDIKTLQKKVLVS